MEEKHIMFFVLGIVAFVTVIGMTLALTSETTGLIYGGAIKGVYYPYSADRLIKAGSQQGIYPLESTEAYARTQMAIYNSRATERIQSTLTSCTGQAAEGNIPPEYVNEYSFNEILDRGMDWKTDCINVYELIGGKGYCCKTSGTHSRFY